MYRPVFNKKMQNSQYGRNDDLMNLSTNKKIVKVKKLSEVIEVFVIYLPSLKYTCLPGLSLCKFEMFPVILNRNRCPHAVSSHISTSTNPTAVRTNNFSSFNSLMVRIQGQFCRWFFTKSFNVESLFSYIKFVHVVLIVPFDSLNHFILFSVQTNSHIQTFMPTLQLFVDCWIRNILLIFLFLFFSASHKAMDSKRWPTINDRNCSPATKVAGEEVGWQHFIKKYNYQVRTKQQWLIKSNKGVYKQQIGKSRILGKESYYNKVNNQQIIIMSYLPIATVPNSAPNISRLPSENKNDIPSDQPVQNRSAIFTTLFENQYQLVKGPRSFMITVAVLGLIFLVLSIVTLILALNVKDIDVAYASNGKCTSGITSQKCSVTIHVSQNIPGPVYFLYYVKNLYINHRRFLSSFSVDQKLGKAISPDVAQKQCGNFPYNANLSKTKSWGGYPLNPNGIGSLCGAKPYGYFNDTFVLYKNGQQVNIDESNIYHGKAVNSLRGPNSQVNQWVDPQNQHFKLYMLDGSLMTKKRLWGVISDGLPAGDYNLVATHNYQMAGMKIIKGVQMTTANVLGGKQFFYCVSFFILFILCLGFFIFLRVRLANYSFLKEHDVRFKQ